MPSGGEHLHRQIPDATVDSHILRNGRDRPGTDQAAARCSTDQASTQEILLKPIRDPPEIIPNILRSPAGEKLRRLESAHGSLRESELSCALGQLKLLIHWE